MPYMETINACDLVSVNKPFNIKGKVILLQAQCGPEGG